MKLVNKIKTLIIITFFFCILPFYTYASEIELITETTKEFNAWNNLDEIQRENTLLPEIFTTELPDNIYNLETQDSRNVLRTFRQLKYKLGNKKSELDKYNLTQDIEIYVKNQEMTGQCWAFSTLSSMETNIALSTGEYKDFSERHMAYATSKKFIDGENENGFNKKVNEYGLQTIALAYLTNGQGAVLEEKMPFENNENEIYLDQIDIEKDTYVTDYEIIPSIYKNYDKDGNLIYSNGNGKIYTQEDVSNIRNQIKQHIAKYGAISAVTAATRLEYYNNQDDIRRATAYYCNNENVIRDHAVTIIGWDDNYSKDNFNEQNKPTSDGAYIVLNSYGEEVFNEGYLYVSYDDILIETSLYGITDTSSEEYYNIYQHDYYGGIANLGTNNRDTGYYANIYTRNINDKEKLDNVGVSICDYVKLNIYINPKGDDLLKENLVKVGTTDVLNPGYHTIDITDVELTSDRFAVVVEQISENNKFMFTLETYIEGTVYDVVTSKQGNSKVSFDGNTWYNLSDFGTVNFIDASKSDICIKAFTKKINENVDPNEPSNPEEPVKPEPELPTEPQEPLEPEQPELPEETTNEIISTIYKLEDEYIKNIEYNTTCKKFLEGITSTQEIKILENNKEIFEDDILKTGMLLISGEKEYKIVVSGDINGDGKITLLDISKIILHYNEQKGFVLNGANKEAGDISEDGKISLIDISRLIILFNKIS